jgi:hypothetical protein
MSTMSLVILGDVNVVHFGPRDNPALDRYWAERGMIHHEDTTTGAYTAMTVRQFLLRLNAVNDMLGNSRATLAKGGFAHYDEIERQQRFVEQGSRLALRAREQGMPSDPQARSESKRRSKLTVVMPDARHTF